LPVNIEHSIKVQEITITEINIHEHLSSVERGGFVRRGRICWGEEYVSRGGRMCRGARGRGCVGGGCVREGCIGEGCIGGGCVGEYILVRGGCVWEDISVGGGCVGVGVQDYLDYKTRYRNDVIMPLRFG